MKRKYALAMVLALSCGAGQSAFSQGMFERASLFGAAAGAGAGMSNEAGQAGNNLSRLFGGAAGSVNGMAGHRAVDPEVAAAAIKESGRLASMAQTKLKAGDTEQACKLYVQAINTRWRIWGAQDASVIPLSTKVGELYEKQHKLSDAEACYRLSLTAVNKREGPGSFSSTPLLDKLAHVCSMQNKPGEAADLLQRAETLKSRQYGAGDSRTVATSVNLAAAYSQAQKYDQANEVYKRLVATPAVASSPQYSGILEKYSGALRQANHPDEAQKIDAQLAQVRQVSGNDAAPPAAAATAPVAAPPAAKESSSASASDTAPVGAK